MDAKYIEEIVKVAINWVFLLSGALITGSCGIVYGIIQRKINHRCPIPPETQKNHYTYFSGRGKLKIDGKKTKMCVYQHALLIAPAASGCEHSIDTRKTYIRCSDGKVVVPDVLGGQRTSSRPKRLKE